MRSPFFILPVLAVCLSGSPLCAAQLNASSTLADIQPSSSIAATETKFDPVIEDLPLMTGLAAVPDEETLFVAPHAGRIAESVAMGAVDIDEVYRFYRRALPHLGWQKIDGRTYRRHGEKLRINARAEGKVTTVHFSVKPE
jgi:hypothetical protein